MSSFTGVKDRPNLTGGDIKAAYEAQPNTNEFSDLAKQKLIRLVDDNAEMALIDDFSGGNNCFILATGETFYYVAGSTLPVSNFVVDGVGGQWVSKRTVYVDYTEAKGDTRSFTEGHVLTIRGIEGTLTATDGAGNWNGANAGAQAFVAVSVTGDTRLWGEVGGGVSNDTVALQAAVAAADKVMLGESHVLTGQLLLRDWQTVEGDRKSQIKMQAANTVLPILAVAKQGLHLAKFRIDGASGGQIDAGLIQINGCSDFLIEDLLLENGGTIASASPQGVNGLSFATNAYPGGEKSSGRIARVITRNFTKAPFNWTTFAEGGVLTDSEFYDSVGNGQTPGIQVNGGRKLKAHNNLVDGTEGAGVAIASVGTTPAYAAQDIEISGNTYRRIGELGQTNSEQFVYLISDGQAAGDLRNVQISNEIIEGCAGGILKTAGNVEEIRLHHIRSRNTQGGYDLQDVDNAKLTRLIVEDFNSDSNTSLALFSLRGATNVAIDGADINSEGLDTTGYIFSCTVASSGIRAKNIHYQGALKLLTTSIADFLTDAKIEATAEKISLAGENTEIQLLKIPNGRTLQADIEVSTANGSIHATQRLKVSVDAAAGTATIRENAFLFNEKAGITTGLSVDIDVSNVLRIRFLNSSASKLVLQTKVKFIFD